jgi:hypothetical protein
MIKNILFIISFLTSEWQIFGDRVPGDYVTDIAVFVPSSEINFKKYDSYKDFKKLDTRVQVIFRL